VREVCASAEKDAGALCAENQHEASHAVIEPYRAGIWKQPPKSRELGSRWRLSVQRGNVDYMITSDKGEKLRGWFSGRLPEGIYSEIIDLTVDREEITVLGRIPEPSVGDGATPAEREAAAEGRIAEFRERTREQRMEGGA
jgi:hypothetical protein